MKQLPKDWINANICAVHKKGNKSDLSNYRPISLTSIPCKIIEGFVRDHIMKHLFNNNQYGFLKRRLLRIMDEWTEFLESGGQINVIYADFEKALLIRKLRCYKVNDSLDRMILA